ncbi:MAG: PHP domain-containing protein [Candidatus Micrarchaeota archaeon]|nr:PHP domain-containing protein [Candidatus Micrarchaeota archaeon]
MAFKFDLHIHTTESYDGHSSLDDYIISAKSKNFFLLGISEHDKFNGELINQLKNIKKNFFFYKGINILLGTELNFNGIHVLVYPSDFDSSSKVMLLKKKFASDALSFVELCSAENIITILAHPFRLKQFLKFDRKFIIEIASKTAFCETVNGRSFFSNVLSSFYIINKKTCLANSDSHHVYELGNAYTILSENVKSYDQFFDCLRQNNHKVVYSPNLYSLLYSRYLKLKKKVQQNKSGN